MNRRPKTIQYSHIDSYHSELGKYILKFLLPLRKKKHLALFSTLETIAGW
jgi:hypothetical protein